MHLPPAIVLALRIFVWLILGLGVALLTIVATLFLYVASFPWAWARIAIAAVFVLGVLALFVLLKPRWKAVLAFLCLYAVVHGWYALIPASNDRNWQPDVARVPAVEFDGDRVTVRNLRAFRYRSVEDYDEAWETKTYDLGRLSGLDLYFVYWGPKDIAHTMFTFNFDDGQHLTVSVETRKEIGEDYDPLRSLFKQFELIYILGDERDLIALRSNYRLEDVYLMPTDVAPVERRALLVDILERADELGRKPEFYRTLAANCTTTLLSHLDNVRSFKVPFTIEVLLNGRMPRMAYNRGQLPNDIPYEEMMQLYSIDRRAQDGGDGPGFSERIRVGLGPALVELEQ